MILIKNKQKFCIDTTKLKNDALTILCALGYADFDLGILLTTPKQMQWYNHQYRNKDKVTDILSFPYHQLKAGERITVASDDDCNVGDIILCPEYINADLDRWDKSFQERIDILLVHGICHLLGYDHIDDKDYEVMKAQEESLLKLID